MTTDERPATLSDHLILLWLIGLNILNMVDRSLLVSFSNDLVTDLSLSDTQFGLLQGLLFIVFYAVAGLFTGGLADLTHRPRLIGAGLALWSALTAASGLATSFVGLAIPRTLIGVGESSLTPTAMSILSDRYPRSQLGFASGAYYMGVPLGVGGSLVVAGLLGPLLGWRGAFQALGALGLVVAVITALLPETPRRAREVVERRPLREVFLGLRTTLASSATLRWTLLGALLVHLVIGAASFDQLWLVKERGYDKVDIAVKMGLMATVFGVIGNLFGGLASDLWRRRTGRDRPMLLAVIMGLCLPIGVVARWVPAGHPVFWLGAALSFFQLGTFYGPVFATVQDQSPPELRSTVVGFAILVLNLFGLALGITVTGLLIDGLRRSGVDQPYTVALTIVGAASALAVPCFALAGRRTAG